MFLHSSLTLTWPSNGIAPSPGALWQAAGGGGREGDSRVGYFARTTSRRLIDELRSFFHFPNHVPGIWEGNGDKKKKKRTATG